MEKLESTEDFQYVPHSVSPIMNIFHLLWQLITNTDTLV